MEKLYVILAVVVVLVILLIFAYEKGWLNKILPQKWQKHKTGFVGAFGRTPGMQNCLAYAGPHRHATTFNRCTHA